MGVLPSFLNPNCPIVIYPILSPYLCCLMPGRYLSLHWCQCCKQVHPCKVLYGTCVMASDSRAHALLALKMGSIEQKAICDCTFRLASLIITCHSTGLQHDSPHSVPAFIPFACAIHVTDPCIKYISVPWSS